MLEFASLAGEYIKPGVSCQWTEGGRQTAEGGKQKAEGRKQKAEGRKQKAEGFSIFHFPFVICHLSLGQRSSASASIEKQQMENYGK
jgi:hypothetical protein